MAKKRKKRATQSRPQQTSNVRPNGSRNWFLVTLLALTGAVVVLSVVALTRGGDEGNGSAVRDLLAPTDPGPIHVHGLGINPADKSLFIATHTGTYRAPQGVGKATRVGDSRQDTMGFTVVGPNRFLGSGHPDVRTNLPTRLGLIESTDEGKTWTPISLLGEADFHVLRSRGKRVYGFDSTNGRLLVSGDSGRTWSQRPIPGPLIDLAVHPQKPSRIVATTEGGIIASQDDARTWRALGSGVGLLAWPIPSRLFLVDGSGAVHVSGDSGKQWTAIGDIGGQPAAFLGQTADELYVALHDGTVKQSRDGGRTWTVRSAP